MTLPLRVYDIDLALSLVKSIQPSRHRPYLSRRKKKIDNNFPPDVLLSVVVRLISLGIDLHLILWWFQSSLFELYRLGRLQLIQWSLRKQFRTFRHLKSREIILLARSEREFRSDGQINGTGGIADLADGWTSRLVINFDFITGTHIDPVGVAKPEEIRLRRKEWKQILTPRDLILEIHIPAGSPNRLLGLQRHLALGGGLLASLFA